jgi:hypothetical protein
MFLIINFFMLNIRKKREDCANVYLTRKEWSIDIRFFLDLF